MPEDRRTEEEVRHSVLDRLDRLHQKFLPVNFILTETQRMVRENDERMRRVQECTKMKAT